jgi:hypothetical protein
MGVEAFMPAEFMEKIFTELAGLSGQEISRTDAWRDWGSQLVDPEGWRDTLVTYASTVRLAVALTDREGRLLGTCHNPQPVWSLAQADPRSIEVVPFVYRPQYPAARLRTP